MIVTIKPIQGTLPHEFIWHVQNFILTFVVWPILSILTSDTHMKFVWEYFCLKQRLFKVHFFISWCFYLSRSTIVLFSIWVSFTDTDDSQDNRKIEGPSLFLSATFICLQILRHLFATLRLRWLLRYRNGSAFHYQTVTGWDRCLYLLELAIYWVSVAF